MFSKQSDLTVFYQSYLFFFRENHVLPDYCIFAKFHHAQVISQQGASVSELPAALRRPQKNTPLDFEAVFCDCCVILSLLVFFSKYSRSDQMTMLARRASKSCPRSRSQCPEMFFLELISLVILGMIEPWPECQPEQSWE